VTFQLFSTADCSGPPIFTSTVPVTGATATSALTPNLGPGTYRWIASYSGDAANHPVAGHCNDANENVTIAPPIGPSSISVTKTADPLSRPVPGGSFTFTVVVTNTGTNAVAIERLTDDIYGDVATRAGSTCGALIGFILDPGQTSAPCSFPVTYTAPQPASQTDVVTATAVDRYDRHPQAHDDATITLTRRAPTITTDASPTVLLGGSITDTATLQGASSPTGTVTFRVHGPDDATCSRPPASTSTVTVSAGGQASSASFVPTQPGTYRWVASYSGDVNNAPAAGACNDAREQVLVQPQPPAPAPPTIVVRKNALPASLPAPGGVFTFRVRVTNTSGQALTLESLVDSVYGDLDGLGSCSTPQALAVGATYECRFTGVFLGDPGASETDVVEAVAVDPTGRRVHSTDDETVTLTGRLSLGVTKTAAPVSRPAPGGDFQFTVVVTNPSPVPVTITTAADDVYGNIGAGGCRSLIGTRLVPGATATCTFTGRFTGAAGSSQRDVVVVTALDDSGHPVEAMDDATVTLTAAPVAPTTPPPTVLPVTIPAPVATIPRTGSDTARTTASAVAAVSFGLLLVGLADERRRRAARR
jgi:hypothetical protein